MLGPAMVLLDRPHVRLLLFFGQVDTSGLACYFALTEHNRVTCGAGRSCVLLDLLLD